MGDWEGLFLTKRRLRDKVIAIMTTATFALILQLLMLPMLAAAQYGSVSVPVSEDDTANAEKLITAQGPPPDASIYQAQTEAYNQVNSFHSYLTNLSGQRESIQRAQNRYPQLIADAQSSAEKCENPQQIYEQLNPFNYGFFGSDGDDPAPDAIVELFRKVNPATKGKLICSQIRDQNFAAQLSTSVAAYFTSRKQRLDVLQKNAIRLQKAWQDRLDKILEQAKSDVGKKSSTQDLVGNLPWIVAILCAFSIGMFVCLRLFNLPIQMELVTSGQVIQFPTVMVLLVVIVSLGLVHILTESSLSALLGGLAGYVLSQGIGRAAARAGQDSNIPTLMVFPSSLEFPDQKQTTTSAPQTVTVTNSGKSSQNVNTKLSGDYSVMSDLTGALSPGGTASFSVTFSPTQIGDRSGTLNFQAGSFTQTVNLKGKCI